MKFKDQDEAKFCARTVDYVIRDWTSYVDRAYAESDQSLDIREFVKTRGLFLSASSHIRKLWVQEFGETDTTTNKAFFTARLVTNYWPLLHKSMDGKS